MMIITVLINGANGKMGQQTSKALSESNQFKIVGQTGRNDDLAKEIKTSNANVVVDFTTAAVAYQNAKIIIEAGARPVIGTTGFMSEQIQELSQLCQQKKLGAIIAPNFSIGAVLMMQYSREIAKHFPHVEIIELHHDQKADAPSGTAIKTAEMIAEVRTNVAAKVIEKELIPGARGGKKHNVHIHSIRLPGLVAHQEVIFGGVGETLTLRHDTISREAFMPGVLLACKKVLELDHLVYGLEHIL